MFEVENYGAMLNANRTYYLSRSQPPLPDPSNSTTSHYGRTASTRARHPARRPRLKPRPAGTSAQTRIPQSRQDPGTSTEAARPIHWWTFATGRTSSTGSRATTRRCQTSLRTVLPPWGIQRAGAARVTCQTGKDARKTLRRPVCRSRTSCARFRTSETACDTRRIRESPTRTP